MVGIDVVVCKSVVVEIVVRIDVDIWDSVVLGFDEVAEDSAVVGTSVVV